MDQPCFNCGTMVDPTQYGCHYCGEVICGSCDERPGAFGLGFVHAPDEHLQPPPVCDACGSLDTSTTTLAFGNLCLKCSLTALGLCDTCGQRECICDQIDSAVLRNDQFGREF